MKSLAARRRSLPRGSFSGFTPLVAEALREELAAGALELGNTGANVGEVCAGAGWVVCAGFAA
jgi:hypothetical protein